MARAQKVEWEGDCVVVGGGAGGLVAALRLARAGARVALVEANHQLGGLTTSIGRQGFQFDVGCQSFESMGLLFPILERLGQPGEEGFHRVHHRLLGANEADPGQPRFKFEVDLSSWDALIEGWIQDEDIERHHVEGLLSELRPVERAIATMAKHPPFWLLPEGEQLGGAVRGGAAMVPHLWPLMRAFGKRWSDVVRRHLPESAVARYLIRAGYQEPNLLAVAGFYHSWFRDYWYPRGGMGAWTRQLGDAVEEAGGSIHLRQPVDGLLIEGGRIAGCTTSKGSTFRAPRLIWTGPPQPLYQRLLAGEPGVDARFRAGLEKAPSSDPMLSLYLGLDMPLEQLQERLRVAHTFYFPDDKVELIGDHRDDPDAHARTWVQLNAPQLHEPDFAPEGKSCLVVQAFSDVKWLDRWGLGGNPRGDRGRDKAYKELKKKVAAELCATASQVVPELADRVVYSDLGSPMSLTRFTGHPDGSTAGWPFHPADGPLKRPFMKTTSDLPGLYTAGQWFVQPGGVPFVAFGGWTAAGKCL